MPPRRIFLTGEPGCGKTTALRRACEILAEHGNRVGGITSDEIRKNGLRIGFQITDMMTGQTGILANTGIMDGPRIGKYTVNLYDIENLAAPAIRRAVRDADLVAIDEIGPMELKSEHFVRAVEHALNSAKPIIGTIHKRGHHQLVTAIKSNRACEIIEVTEQNREETPNRLVVLLFGKMSKD